MKKNKQIVKQNTFTEFLLYTTPNGKVKVEIFLRDETVWLTQARIAELFGVDRSVVTKHLLNIYEDGELDKKSTSAKIAQVQNEGQRQVTRDVEFYNLDAILSVGYRVSSAQATSFRIWATERLREYIIKGFTMDDERLKDPRQIFGVDYFEEQLARIRNIRSSERRMYQKVTDIYAECSADYSPESDITKQFFATVQNKLHFAITGQTAAEIIHSRVDSSKENMGLTVWKNSPKGSIRETDVVIAKNYLNEKELDHLNRIVTMYLDFAEMQAKRGILMRMNDWVAKLDAFLKFNERDILGNAGKVSHDIAEALAIKEYEVFRVKRDRTFESDFDRVVKKLLRGNKRRGGYIALVTVLVTGAVSVAIAVSLLLLGLGSSRTSFSLEQSNQTKALANACSEEALQQIRDSTPFEGSGNLSLGQGNCNYTVTKQTAQNRTITSIGTVGTIVRKVKITIDKITPDINITSWQEVADF